MNSSGRPPWTNPIGAQHIVETLEDRLQGPPEQGAADDADEHHEHDDDDDFTLQDPETPD